MAKLTRKQKIELYKKWKQGKTVSSLSKEYQIRSDNINFLVQLIGRHGFDILRSDKNNYYSPELKLEIINKVLIDGKSIISTAITSWFWDKSVAIDNPTYPVPATAIFILFLLSICFLIFYISSLKHIPQINLGLPL